MGVLANKYLHGHCLARLVHLYIPAQTGSGGIEAVLRRNGDVCGAIAEDCGAIEPRAVGINATNDLGTPKVAIASGDRQSIHSVDCVVKNGEHHVGQDSVVRGVDVGSKKDVQDVIVDAASR